MIPALPALGRTCVDGVVLEHGRPVHEGSAGGDVMMFGGTGAGNETWQWNGTTWTQLTPNTVPPPRQWHLMVYDPNRSKVVMTGGSR